MHDSTVDRTTNGTGKGTEMTIEQLKALVVDEKEAMPTTVPTWEEVVKEFKDTDIVFYCHINITTDANVAEFCRIVDEYDFWDNVVFFIGYAKRTDYHSESEIVSDGIPFVAGDYPALVAGFYDYDSYAEESFYYQLSTRGFLNYHSITNTQAKLDSTLLTSLGSGGVLTDNIDLTDDYAFAIDVCDEVVYTGKNIDSEKTIMRITDDTVENCNFIQLSGTPLVQTEYGYTLADENDAVIVYYADVSGGESTYRIYSAPVKLSYGGCEIYDANSDGTFSVADIMLLLKDLADDSVNVSAANDANSDGVFNLLDIIRLMKYLME